jgi:TRAP-type uncharacterized transport system substrate-binding protein
MSKKESQAILDKFLSYLQSNKYIRLGIGFTIIAVLLFFAGRFAWGLLPREYSLKITGGDIVSNPHYLARILDRETNKAGVDLDVVPKEGTLAELDAVSRGEVDLAFVQGGIEKQFPNVEHVAMVTVEAVHLLVRPGTKTVEDLKGKTINFGGRESGSREVALKITQFAGLQENVDYVETNLAPEELLALPDHKMPDALFLVSSLPSFLIEILVRERGYTLMEIAFPQSLALRQGWANNGKILAYTYSLGGKDDAGKPTPPVPEKDISTVAVNLYLVANSKANPAAIEKVLEALYSPSVSSAYRATFDDKNIAQPSGYPISQGMVLYQQRNDSVFTPALWSKLQGIFGLVMTFSGMGIVVLKWFKGPPAKVEYADKEFQGFVKEVAKIEKQLGEMDTKGKLDQKKLIAARDTLGGLRVTILEKMPKSKFKDAHIFDRVAASVRAAHDRTISMLGRAG